MVRLDVVNKIETVIEEFHGQALHQIQHQIAEIGLTGEHRRFVINRMGSTGSSWLAKLLNSHPDVSCTHEGVVSRVFPRRSFDLPDILDLVRLLATDTMHDAYRAAGDVGSAWIAHTVALRGKFTTALLVRHPARLLNTRLHVFPNDPSFSQVPLSSQPIIQRLWDIDIDKVTPLDKIFLHDLLTFASQVFVLNKVDMILRIEDLQDIEYCSGALLRLTGVPYDSDVVARATGHPVNVRTQFGAPIQQILAGFSPSQRHWYHTILQDVAPLFGYDLAAV